MKNQPPSTPPPLPCPLCQGQRVWAEIMDVTGHYRDIQLIYAHEKPGRRSAKTVEMIAAVCLNCGSTGFYAMDVLKMRTDFQQHPEWFDNL